MGEAVDALQTLFRAPLTPGVRVLVPNLVNNLFAIKIYPMLNFTKICLMVWISIGYKYIFCALDIIFFVLCILDLHWSN